MEQERKQLFKSSENRTICGVCGGIGEYFNVDPTVIRLIWVIVTFCSLGTALLAYIVAAVIIPERR